MKHKETSLCRLANGRLLTVAVFGGECFVVTTNDTKAMVEQTGRLLVVAVFGGECGGSEPGQLDLKEHHLDVSASATLLAVARGVSL